tara:strand:- start:166 stop:387 length:222 start_codon:yes stop_codon:yes gene_type:complete
MAKWDMTKRNVTPDGKVISTGQKITPLFDDNSKLEERVSNMENKLDTILTLLNKEDKNDKDRPKPVSGNDSGV